MQIFKYVIQRDNILYCLFVGSHGEKSYLSYSFLKSLEDRTTLTEDEIKGLNQLQELNGLTLIEIEDGDLFFGTREQFMDCFLMNSDDLNIKSWALKNGYSCNIFVARLE